MSELYQFCEENTGAASTACRKMLLYLESCNKLLENGLLGHEKVIDMDLEVLKSIDKGYEFFIIGLWKKVL